MCSKFFCNTVIWLLLLNKSPAVILTLSSSVLYSTHIQLSSIYGTSVFSHAAFILFLSLITNTAQLYHHLHSATTQVVSHSYDLFCFPTKVLLSFLLFLVLPLTTPISYPPQFMAPLFKYSSHLQLFIIFFSLTTDTAQPYHHLHLATTQVVFHSYKFIQLVLFPIKSCCHSYSFQFCLLQLPGPYYPTLLNLWYICVNSLLTQVLTCSCLLSQPHQLHCSALLSPLSHYASCLSFIWLVLLPNQSPAVILILFFTTPTLLQYIVTWLIYHMNWAIMRLWHH